MWKEYGFKAVKLSYSINYLKIPVNNVPITDEGAEVFNKFYLHYLHSGFAKIVRTKSGGISIAKKNFFPPMWDCQVTNSFIELTIVDDMCYRVQFSNFGSQEKKVSGRQSYLTVERLCEKYGINLDNLAIDNGEEIKKEIEKPKIKLFAEEREVVDNCHHLDLNSSHISGMVKYYPILTPVFEELYDKRKENGVYKDVLTHCWGYFQSKYTKGKGYKFAHISRDGMKYTNDMIDQLTQKLVESGRRIVAWNTDGIWYQGEVYHGPGEGDKLGMWKNDHTNCIFRAKSAGSYEFIENDKYTPVVRGRTRYDSVKPRTEWKWGDIFRQDCKVISFYFIEGEGIVKED